MRKLTVAALAVAVSATALAGDGWPFMTIRMTSGALTKPDKLAELIAINAKHPGSVDEYWFAFGAGKPVEATAQKFAGHNRFAESLAAAGITFGSQQGVTLGHSENWVADADFPDDAFEVDSKGNRLRRFCPRSPRVLEYEEKLVEAIVKATKVRSIWLDDDLRMAVGSSSVCFCEHCMKAFNEKYGLDLTREQLVARLTAKTPKEDLREKWRLFKNESLALYAAAARRGADRADPTVRLAYQSVDANYVDAGESYLPVLEALAGGNGRQSGIRVGSGNYIENMTENYLKSIGVAREAERCRRAPFVAQVSYEQETYTREVLHKSAEAALIESAMALSAGADALTEYWWDAGRDEPASYYEEFAKMIVEWRPYLEMLGEISKRTSLGGLTRYVGADHLKVLSPYLRGVEVYDLGSIGIPLTVCEARQGLYYLTGRSVTELGAGDAEKIAAAGAVVDAVVWDDLLKFGGETLKAAADAGRLVKADLGVVRPHGLGKRTLPTHAERTAILDAIEKVGLLPVRIERMHRLFVYPRVTPEGRVAAVSIVNGSIGKCLPTEVKIRKPATNRVLWHRPGANPVELAVRPGAKDEIAVTIPELPGSQIGTLVFEKEPEIAKPERKMNILCVCAHPDDAELNCGGTLLKYRKMGHDIFVVLTTSGNTGSNEMTDVKEIERVREAEMLASAKTYGAQVRFLRADDERLLDSNEMRTKVLDAMRWANPDVIFTHSPTDESPDHWMTSKLVRAMVISLPGINQQSSEKPCSKKVSVFTWGNAKGIGFVPEVYVDISDELEPICAAANLHESQKAYLKMYKGPKDLSLSKRATAAFYGLQYGCKAAEAFRTWRISGYMPDYKILP